jgi:hypothetical protein
MEEKQMKKYISPAIEIIELQAKENIAANPLDAVVSGDGTTTTYNLALLGAGSQPQV